MYWLISILVAIAIIFTNVSPLNSQTISANESNNEPEAELVDLAEFSDTLDKLETKWEADYEQYFDRNFSHSSRSAKKIARQLTDVKERSKINPAVIWAIPNDDFLQLMLVTPNNQFVVKQVRGATRKRLTQRIRDLEAGIGDRNSLKYLPPARLIYNWLFKPLDPYLAAEGIDTVLLCTGTTLRSLPFSALHDGEKFVVEKYNIARIPAFSLTDTSYQPRTDKKVLATGASEFDDLPSLPGVEIELDTIVPKLWSGEKILNQDFTVANLKQAHQSGSFDIIHIASHSLFDSGSPENSYIQFDDRKLSLDQLTNLELDLPQVDLLVLSACETALGNKDAEFGFAGLAMQSGVKSALASLWTISDAGTVVLMSEFYQELRSTPIKAEALRKAQLSMLQQKVYVEGTKVRGSAIEVDLPSNTARAELQNFNHPFYWAGFTIIGNPW
ncbi:CHAT domain-containing protein [Waterburya agarophytonicola K14]|uniref:CHAT domain-containing protein n=2 Tax=Waterburya TaxID=2886915 RepID=A0A964BQ42_9CYAN|nr:CHAT domain-containing protein [Waterburya agarophytonicola KI4]